MKIVYAGAFRPGSLTASRLKALKALGNEVEALDRASFMDRGSYLMRKMQMHCLAGPGVAGYNKEIVRLSKESLPDLIYIDMGIHLWPETVKELKKTGALFVHYTSEHFGFRSYLYRHFGRTVPLYDVHIVTFPHAAKWLEDRGAKKVILSEFGYDPDLHRIPRLTPEEKNRHRADAVFVGHWEKPTEEMVIALRNAGIDVRVCGPGWRRNSRLVERKNIRPVYGDEYVRVLASAKICLCFLSREGKNNYSASRTFEIPAAGGFLLAERTESHLAYFREGREAEFFSSREELIDKAKYYLSNDSEREAVARAGHHRCMSSGYSHMDRMRDILAAIP